MRFPRGPVVAVLVLAALLPVARAGAASRSTAGSPNDERIAQLQEQLGEVSRAELDATVQLDAVARRRQAFDARVAALDAQIGSVQARIQARQREAIVLIAAALELDRRAHRVTQKLRRAQQKFDDTAVSLYSGNTGPAVAYTSLVFDAASVTELGSGRAYLEHVSEARQHAVDELAGLRKRNRLLREAAEERRADVDVAREAAEVEQATLKELRARQAEQRDAAAKHEARERNVVARIRSKKSEYTAELAALQATSTEVSALLYDLQAGQPRGSHFDAERPVPGYVTSGFGWRYHPVLGYSRLHAGLDFHAGYGTSIEAAAAGRVVWAGPRGGYGNCVVIDHGGQYATLYGHASAFFVNVGDQVEAGTTIAAVGASGLATGPHLHFEVRILGSPVDPAQYL